MDINRDSWHYKIVYYWNDEEDWKMPTSLCKYMQQLFASFLLAIFLLALAALVVGLLGIIIWSFLSITVWNVINGLPPHLLFTDMVYTNTVVEGDPSFMAVAYFVNSGLLIYGVGYVIYTLFKWIFELLSFLMTKLKTPPGEEGSLRELFWQYSNSIKEGICPTIHYVYKESNDAD